MWMLTESEHVFQFVFFNIYFFFIYLFICGGAQVEVGTISLVTTFHLHLVVPSTTWVSTAVVVREGGVVMNALSLFSLSVNVWHMQYSRLANIKSCKFSFGYICCDVNDLELQRERASFYPLLINEIQMWHLNGRRPTRLACLYQDPL